MNDIAPEKLRSLKENQLWTFFSGLMQLRRQIYRYAIVPEDTEKEKQKRNEE